MRASTLRAFIEHPTGQPIPTAQLEAIERVFRAHPDRSSAAEFAAGLPEKSASRTLQSQLSRLIRDGRLVLEGAGSPPSPNVSAHRTLYASALPATPREREHHANVGPFNLRCQFLGSEPLAGSRKALVIPRDQRRRLG